MILLVWTICTVIVILWVKLRLRQEQLGSYVKNLPKIPFKVLLPFLRPNQTTADLFKNIEGLTNYHEGLAAFFAGPRLAVVCSDPENMKTILMSKDCLNKPYLYRMVPQISNGLLFSSGNLSCNICVRLRMKNDNFSIGGSPQLARGSQKYQNRVCYEHSENI